MGKHHAQFVVMVRPTFSTDEVMVGMPFVDDIDANHEADRHYMAGNYSARVVAINPATGLPLPDEYDVHNYNTHAPLI